MGKGKRTRSEKVARRARRSEKRCEDRWVRGLVTDFTVTKVTPENRDDVIETMTGDRPGRDD